MNLNRPVLIIISVALLSLIGIGFFQASRKLPESAYSEFLADLEAGRLQETSIKGNTIIATDRTGTQYTTFSPDLTSLMPLLQASEVTIRTHPAPVLTPLFRDMLIIVLLLGGWMILSRGAPSSSKRFLRTGTTSKASKTKTGVTFNDVAGISEARDELKEIIDFLKHPTRYSRLGGQIPKGVLLEGLPGTGKTLLAKAIAGEASVPFFSMGGSDFVEMFAGLGASRVRKLFEEAKKQAPCIIFIDEIDAIGGKRSADYRNGSNDEREQTLNALLVEMDGFETSKTIIVVAATNRSDILDSALLRPGRFDRRITLNLPDIRGRLKILKVHTAGTAISTTVDLTTIARSTPGFTGAEIANLVNEAALLAARKGKQHIEQADFEDAQDKISMGLERKNLVIDQRARRLTAYHEAGHTVVAKLLPESDPLHKTTIIPRGRSLGLTQQLPIGEHQAYTRSYLFNRIKILLGGRLAEELIFGRLTTGASNDLLGATRIAHRLVCEFGMSEQLGPVSRMGNGPPNGDGDSGGIWQQSEQTRREIDLEILRIVQHCYEEAKELLKAHDELLHMLAESLLAHETLDGEEVDIVYRCYLNHRQIEETQRQDEGGN
ncbi:ATP-dependent zinc metalloprotease FtsH [Thermodesulfobacteriota bacterium]